ncbi:MAG: Imelysin [Desulfotalea sp.]|nr:MAG: Imelysin [Desulfotalea sp.]
MNRLFVSLTSMFVAASILGIAPAQAGIQDNVADYLFKRNAKKALESYTDNTILKTIDQLVKNIRTLNNDAKKLHADKNEKYLDKTIAAWRATVASFNRSQIFMYGPAAQYDFHKQLSIWPADKILIDNTLDKMSKGLLQLGPAQLRKMTASMRGLNTVKYLLFSKGLKRDIGTIKDTELDYLVAVTDVLQLEAIDFEASWVGTNNLSADKLEIVKKAGLKNWSSYAKEFKNPGEPYSRYLSVSVPLQELIQESTSVIEDILPIIEELATREPLGKLHYWDRIDPYADILNGLKGVENSYLGGIPGSRGTSFSDLVATKDAVLDKRIKIAFAHAQKRIETIRSLENGPQEKRELAVKVAVSECEKLLSRLMVATPLVTADPAVEPFAPYGSNI